MNTRRETLNAALTVAAALTIAVAAGCIAHTNEHTGPTPPPDAIGVSDEALGITSISEPNRPDNTPATAPTPGPAWNTGDNVEQPGITAPDGHLELDDPWDQPDGFELPTPTLPDGFGVPDITPIEHPDINTSAPGIDRDAHPDTELSRIVRIIDGDTFVIDGDIRVRLIGIDTPEMGFGGGTPECYAHEATVRAEQLAPIGAPVRLTYDAGRYDRYGRTLAYVHVNGVDINETLLAEGYATTMRIPPNTTRADRFAELEAAAAASGAGGWSACNW